MEPGESLEESALRELWEESGLQGEDLHWRGCVRYLYDTKPKAWACVLRHFDAVCGSWVGLEASWKVLEVNVFDLFSWQGEERETEEMAPKWFLESEIPLQSMWADDAHWLLQYLRGELRTPFTARFRFKGHEGVESSQLLEHHVRPLAMPAVPGSGVKGSALLVSTVCLLGAPSKRVLESFVRYHLERGFQRIFIVVDSPEASEKCRVKTLDVR